MDQKRTASQKSLPKEKRQKKDNTTEVHKENTCALNKKSDSYSVLFTRKPVYNHIPPIIHNPKIIPYCEGMEFYNTNNYRNLDKIKSVDAKRKLFVSPDPDDYETKILNLFNII